MAELRKLGRQMVLSGYVSLGALVLSLFLGFFLGLVGISELTVIIIGVIFSVIIAIFQLVYLVGMTGLTIGQPRIGKAAILIIISIIAELLFSIIVFFVGSINVWLLLVLIIGIPIPYVVGYFQFKKWIHGNCEEISTQIVEISRETTSARMKDYLKLEVDRVGQIIITGVFISFIGYLFAGEFVVILGSVIEVLGILKLGNIFGGEINTKRIYSEPTDNYIAKTHNKPGPFSIRNGRMPILSGLLALYSLLWVIWSIYMALDGGDPFGLLLIFIYLQIFVIPFLSLFAVIKINTYNNKPWFGTGIILFLALCSNYWLGDLYDLLFYSSVELIFWLYTPLILSAISLVILLKIRDFDKKGSNFLLINTIAGGLQVLLGLRFFWADVNMDVHLILSILLWILWGLGYSLYFFHSLQYKHEPKIHVSRYDNKNLVRGILLIGALSSIFKLLTSVVFQIFAGKDGTISTLDPNWDLYLIWRPFRDFINAFTYRGLDFLVLLALFALFIRISQLQISPTEENNKADSRSYFQKELSKRKTRILVGIILLLLFISKYIYYVEPFIFAEIADILGFDLSYDRFRRFQMIVDAVSVVLSYIGLLILIIKTGKFKPDYFGIILTILVILSEIIEKFFDNHYFGIVENFGVFSIIISSFLTGSLFIYLLSKYRTEMSHNLEDFRTPIVMDITRTEVLDFLPISKINTLECPDCHCKDNPIEAVFCKRCGKSLKE